MGKHAYLIMAHADFFTLETLLKLLDYKGNDIFLHIDKKNKNIPWEEIKEAVHTSNLYFIERKSIRWGSYSQIDCELRLLEKAVQTDDYDYYHLLSGSDLPLKTQAELHDFYEEHQGKQFLQFVNESMIQSCNCYERLRYYSFFQGLSKHKSVFVRMMFSIFNAISIHMQMFFHIDRIHFMQEKIAFGANWFSITEALANYVLEQKEWIRKRFQYTRCADELFLQMIVYNSDFYDQVYHKEPSESFDADPILRFIDWTRGNPYVFRLEDKEALFCSGFLFARKFSSAIDKRIIQDIAIELTSEE